MYNRNTMKSKTNIRENISAYLFLLPYIILFSVFIVYSLFSGFWNSLFRIAFRSRIFIGLENFFDLFKDDLFVLSLQNTVTFVLAIVPLSVFIGLWIASTVFDKNPKFVSFIRASYYMPTIVSAVVMTVVWSFLLNSSGVIAFFTREAGLGFINFLGDPNLALATVIFITMTINIGTVVILYIASMAGISVDVLEAAEIDGANRPKKILHIIVPLVRSTTIYVVITNIVAVLRLFVIIDLLTGGGPTYATTTLMYYLYGEAFKFGRMGRASAVGVIMFLIAFIISIPLIRAELKKDSKGG